MTPLALVVALCVVLAAIACVSARRPGLLAVSAAALLGGVALLGQPRPSDLVLLERVAGAALAGELLWLGLRGRTLAGASALRWPALALLAAAAFAAGVAAQRLVPGTGPPEALGTALALFTIALTAVAGRSDGVHLGVAGLVAIAGASVVRLALSGPTSPLETLLVAAVGVAVAGAVVLLVPQVVAPRSLAPAEPVRMEPQETALARARTARRRAALLTERERTGGETARRRARGSGAAVFDERGEGRLWSEDFLGSTPDAAPADAPAHQDEPRRPPSPRSPDQPGFFDPPRPADRRRSPHRPADDEP